MSKEIEYDRVWQASHPPKEHPFNMSYWSAFALNLDDLQRIQNDAPHLIQPREFDRVKMALWRISMASRPGRYGSLPMIHRPNQLTHVQQAADWVGDIADDIHASGYYLDKDKALREAFSHDDTEMWTGDIPTDKKASFSKQELENLWQKEFNAAQAIAGVNFVFDAPAFNGYIAEQIDIHHRISLEAQVVNLIDKALPVGEQIHAHRVGNHGFLKMLPRREQILGRLRSDYPWFADLSSSSLNWITIPSEGEIKEIHPITINDLSDEQSWKKVVLAGELPEIYRRYLKTTLRQPFSEVRLFGDWAAELWQRWGVNRTNLSIEEFALTA